VELDVKIDERSVVFFIKVLLHQSDCFFQTPAVILSRPLRCKYRALNLQPATNLQQLLNAARIQSQRKLEKKTWQFAVDGLHHRATTTVHFDQSNRLQLAKRLAHHRTTDPEHVCHLTLRWQLIAGCHCRVLNVLHQLLRNLISQRFAFKHVPSLQKINLIGPHWVKATGAISCCQAVIHLDSYNAVGLATPPTVDKPTALSGSSMEASGHATTARPGT